MRKLLTILLVCITAPILLSSCWLDKNDTGKDAPVFQQANLDDTLERYGSGEAAIINETIHSPNFSESDVLLQKLLADASASGTTNTGEIIDILMFQLQNTLNQGNYEYNEEAGKSLATDIIAKIIQYDASYENHPYILASQGYAEEINKNLTGAQAYYEKAFDQAQVYGESKGFQAQLLNQVGHIQSLLGNADKAYELTYLAYELEPRDFNTSFNIARHLAYSGSVKQSLIYFEYAAKSPYAPLRSEVYFSMSSLMADTTSELYNPEKAIEYAQLAIENNPDYPMGYYALARIYYMMGDAKNYPAMEEALNKSIVLYPDGYNSHELLGLMKFDKGDFDGAIADIKKSLEVIPKDMLLMEDQRAFNTNRLYQLMILMNYVHSGKPIDDTFKVLFLSDNYGADNVILQLERPGNGFFKSSGDKIRPLFNN